MLTILRRIFTRPVPQPAPLTPWQQAMKAEREAGELLRSLTEFNASLSDIDAARSELRQRREERIDLSAVGHHATRRHAFG